MSPYLTKANLVVAPTERQASALWEADAKEQQQRGLTVWETPGICSWNEFLESLWEEYCLSLEGSVAPLTLANEWQERFLWIKSLEKSVIGEKLLNLPAAAYLAANAWKITCSYQLESELTDPANYWPEETDVLLAWVKTFKEIRDEKGWLDSSSLEGTLSTLLKDGSFPRSALPASVRFVNFTEWTPAVQLLVDTLSECGVEVVQEEPKDDPGSWRSYSALDQEAEVRAAAQWLRQLVSKDPDGQLKVGLVIPNLAERREEINRLLTEIFQPHQYMFLDDPPDPACDFSVGRSLSEWSVAEHALTILRLHGRPQPIEEWALILGSPYLSGAQEEFDPRAQLLLRLYRDRRPTVEWRRVESLANSAPGRSNEACASPDLAARLERFHGELKDNDSPRLPSQWASHFSALLEIIGWPGELSTLDSNEFQAFNRFKQTLAEFGSVDTLYGPIDRHLAYTILRRIADETVFQPKRSGGSVEVLGTLEAVGQHFDYLWLAGFHDSIWPAPCRPNPYLPFSLQRERQVAHATAERELIFARGLTRKLLSASRVGIVSHPEFIDEGPCRPSPLLAHLEPVDDAELGIDSIPTLAQHIFSSTDIEVYHDPGPPEVGADEKTRGGSSLFKHQAACPFRAFALLRLSAKPLDPIERGLDPSERGTLAHAALERLWDDLNDLATWSKLDEPARHSYLETAAKSAVKEMRKQRPDVLRGAMIHLEEQRLTSLLAEWMELEELRKPFQVVATEDKVKIDFAGLHLNVIIDRIDRLESGELVVIDYKTGVRGRADWAGERPKEPQLPLYCVAHQTPVDAICFAILKTGETKFDGLGRTDDLIDGIEASKYGEDGTHTWEDRRKMWKEHLEALAEEFRSGVARVDPLDNDACRYCRLEPLCRIDERAEL